MFSTLGNTRIKNLISRSLKNTDSWEKVLLKLKRLQAKFAEAGDTAVTDKVLKVYTDFAIKHKKIGMIESVLPFVRKGSNISTKLRKAKRSILS